MLIMTAKLDRRRLIIGIVAVLAAIGVLLALFSSPSQQTVSTATADPNKAGSNEQRVEFLKGFGWEVTVSPAESMQVRIPAETNEVFDRYNELQKSQGYDLSRYTGKTVMRYVYTVNNYPEATAPVRATLLVHKGKIIGGDITDTSPGGQVRGFSMPQSNDTTQKTS